MNNNALLWAIFVSIAATTNLNAAECRKTGSVCLESGTRVINGLSVTRTCWNYRDTYECVELGSIDTCAPLRSATTEVVIPPEPPTPPEIPVPTPPNIDGTSPEDWEVMVIKDLDCDGNDDAIWRNIHTQGLVMWKYDGSEAVVPIQDMDGDCIPDETDPDMDGDGISNDYEEQSGTDPRDANSTPIDTDGDGIPDAVDSDDDNDGWTDALEVAAGTDPFDVASVPSDIDNDGIPDSLDSDRDGDGINNTVDAFPDNPMESVDTDGDGIGDNADPDIDNDGYSNDQEIARGSDPYDPSSVPLFYDMTFTEVNSDDAKSADKTISEVLSVSDFNGDGIDDVLFIDTSNAIYLQIMGPSGIAETKLIANAGNGAVSVGDYNGDGSLDIVHRSGWWNAITTLDGDTVLATKTFYFWGSLQLVGAVDLDNDGREELITYNTTTGDISASILTETASYWTQTTSMLYDGASATISSIDLGDINGDGLEDVVAMDGTNLVAKITDPNQSTILTTIGDTTNANMRIEQFGDFNGDGKQDVLLYDQTSGLIDIWTLDGTSLLSSGTTATLPSGTTSASFDIGDFNGDGKDDIAGTYTDAGGTHQIIWMMDGNKEGHTQIIENTWELSVGDFNGDGISDLYSIDDTGQRIYLAQ